MKRRFEKIYSVVAIFVALLAVAPVIALLFEFDRGTALRYIGAYPHFFLFPIPFVGLILFLLHGPLLAFWMNTPPRRELIKIPIVPSAGWFWLVIIAPAIFTSTALWGELSGTAAPWEIPPAPKIQETATIPAQVHTTYSQVHLLVEKLKTRHADVKRQNLDENPEVKAEIQMMQKQLLNTLKDATGAGAWSLTHKFYIASFVAQMMIWSLSLCLVGFHAVRAIIAGDPALASKRACFDLTGVLICYLIWAVMRAANYQVKLSLYGHSGVSPVMDALAAIVIFIAILLLTFAWFGEYQEKVVGAATLAGSIIFGIMAYLKPELLPELFENLVFYVGVSVLGVFVFFVFYQYQKERILLQRASTPSGIQNEPAKLAKD